jgi:hypothetical protein
VKSIKTLGIATAVALALIAVVGAGSASANWFKSEAVKTIWTGQTSPVGGTSKHVLNLPKSNGFTGCKNNFSGETATSVSPSLRVSHRDEEGLPRLHCGLFGQEFIWAMGSCEYRFHSSEGSLEGSVDLVCGKTGMRAEVAGCITTIGNQNNVGTVTFKNVGTGSEREITANAKLEGLTYTNEGACSVGTFHDGTYKGEWVIKGESEGKQVGVWMGPSPTFAAEEAPVSIAGMDAANAKRIQVGRNLVCESYTLSGTSANATSETIALTPAYGSCKFGTEVIPDSAVSAGSCSFMFHANGELDIVGANCASNPMSITSSGCVATIGPQSGRLGFTYANEGFGSFRTMSMSGQANGVTYTAVGAGCAAEGTFSTGSILSTSTLSATTSAWFQQGLWIE